MTILISILSLSISLILAVRLFLLDKTYGEIVLKNKHLKSESYTFSKGHTPGIYQADLVVSKSEIYDFNIEGIKFDDVTIKKENTHKLEEGLCFEIKKFINKPIDIVFSYKDRLNNEYTQKLIIEPIFTPNGELDKDFKSWNIKITNRKWKWKKSLKKYFL